MDNIAYIVIAFFVGLFIDNYVISYLKKKGENLATKEDIKEITKITEDTKKEFNEKFSEFKSTLNMVEHKNQVVYNKKILAIESSLEFLDKYFANVYNINGEVVSEPITITELTEKGRKCYNLLAITCENIKLLDKFNEILFGKNKNFMLLYNEYRNLCRKELRIIEDIKFDEDNVFYVKISTRYLENTKK